MSRESMRVFACVIARIHMDQCRVEAADLVKETVPDLLGDAVALRDGPTNSPDEIDDAALIGHRRHPYLDVK